MSVLELEEHWSVATGGDDPTSLGRGREAELFEHSCPLDETDAILPIKNETCPAVLSQQRHGGGKRS
jgi:hypothetical protein